MVDRRYVILIASLVFSISSFAADKYEDAAQAHTAGDWEAAKELQAKSPLLGYDEVLANAERCYRSLKECTPPFTSLETARLCNAKLNPLSSSCEHDPQAYQEKKKTYFAQLEVDLKRLEAEGKLSSGVIDPTLAGRVRCEKGLKWGYKRGISYDPANYFGKFNTDMECEEAKIQDEKADATQCAERFLGSPETVKLTKRDYMGLAAYGGGFSKGTVYFSSQAECEKATDQPFSYAPPNSEVIQISPASAKEAPKFIGKCGPAPVTLCKQFDRLFKFPVVVR